jgi:hypothetical protein
MEPSVENRRSQRRLGAAVPLRVRGLDTAGQEFNDSTTAIEVSRRGLSFFSKRELAVFATLTIMMPGRGPVRSSEGPSDFLTEAAVVGCVRKNKDWFRIGVRFVGTTFPIYSSETS